MYSQDFWADFTESEQEEIQIKLLDLEDMLDLTDTLVRDQFDSIVTSE